MLLLAFLPLANAQNIDIINTPIGEIQELLAQQPIEVPEAARIIVKDDERINLIIQDTRTINAVLENYVVVSVNEGELEDSTLDLLVEPSAIDKLANSEDLKTTLKELLDSKEIQIKPKGFFSKIKFGIVKLILKFL